MYTTSTRCKSRNIVINYNYNNTTISILKYDTKLRCKNEIIQYLQAKQNKATHYMSLGTIFIGQITKTTVSKH